MTILTQDFAANTDPQSLLAGNLKVRTYTWDPGSSNDLSLQLNVALQLSREGWAVGLESPVRGVQRNYRIPVVAGLGRTLLLVKPVKDPKKVNLAGIKLLDVKDSVLALDSSLEVRAIVYAFLPTFDPIRKTTDDYEIRLAG